MLGLRIGLVILDRLLKFGVKTAQANLIPFNLTDIRWVSLRENAIAAEYIHGEEGNKGKPNQGYQKPGFATNGGNNRHNMRLIQKIEGKIMLTNQGIEGIEGLSRIFGRDAKIRNKAQNAPRPFNPPIQHPDA